MVLLGKLAVAPGVDGMLACPEVLSVAGHALLGEREWHPASILSNPFVSGSDDGIPV